MISIVLAGRNDDYGGNFRHRLFRTIDSNVGRLEAAGVGVELLFVEWNPLPEKALISAELAQNFPQLRAFVVGPDIHRHYSLNPHMPFHEMIAKNVAIRRASGDLILVTNADIIFSDDLVNRIRAGCFEEGRLYRARRVDVRSDTPGDRLDDPAWRLVSGEGTRPPCFYLGGGGDFCLAGRSTWNLLGGLNERIRHTTRIKDWQFYLLAAALGVPTEFVGVVYHLDHGEGFRNTPVSARDRADVHFGQLWDIEFGMPQRNDENWGLRDCAEEHESQLPITVLQPGARTFARFEDEEDEQVWSWLCGPPDRVDIFTAVLLHTLCAAMKVGKRLILRLESPCAAVAASGMAAVAARKGIELFSNWIWPSIPGFSVRPFTREPDDLTRDDWILEESALQLIEGVTPNPLPRRIPIDEPAFNPVLGRRLLYGYLNLLDRTSRQGPLQRESDERSEPGGRIAIYGAGSHTRELLSWGVPDSLQVEAILVSSRNQETPASLQGIAVRSVDEFRCGDVDAVVLSSAAFEADMADLAAELGVPIVAALYADWPVDMWAPSSADSSLKAARELPALPPLPGD